MALIRVAQYNSTPTGGRLQAQNAHLQAFTNQLMTSNSSLIVAPLGL